MITRRIVILGLVAALVLSGVTLLRRVTTDDMAIEDDEIQIISSDENLPNLQVVDGLRKTVMYFEDSNGYLVPVMMQIPWEEGIGKTTLSNMIDSPELRESISSKGLKPIIPAGTKILGMSINPENGLCKVDFSSEVNNKESEKEEENLIRGIVYTLTEFENIDKVQILVEGQEITNLKNGTAMEAAMTREEINLIGKDEEGRSNVLVYFKSMNDNDFDYFVPVTIPTLAPVSNVYTALDLLFEGPPEDSNLISDIPRDVSFQGVEIKDGTAYVDVGLGTESMLTKDATIDNLIKNVGLTLGSFEDINSVEFLVDGEIINTAIPTFANEY